jgi:hypothetical protein
LRVLSSIEVLSAKRLIPPFEPGGGASVQASTSRLVQEFVDRVADQRVREQEVAALRPDQKMADQLGRAIVVTLDQVADLVHGEALAENRGRLQRLPVG